MARDGQVTAEPEDDDLDDELETGETPDPGKPSYEELAGSVARLEAATARNNRELARRRKLGDWMKNHGIEDLDTFLSQHTPAPAPTNGAQASEGTGEVSGNATEPPETHAGPVTPTQGFDEAEVSRRVALELEKRGVEDEERTEAVLDRLRQTELRVALRDAGFTGTFKETDPDKRSGFEKALKVIDFDLIQVSDDLEVTGAEEAVEALKKEIPEWFKKTTSPPPTPRGSSALDGGDKPARPPRPRTWDQQVAERLR